MTSSNTLSFVQTQLTRYGLSAYLILGNIGNILNCFGKKMSDKNTQNSDISLLKMLYQ